MPARLGHGRGPRRPSRFFLTHVAPPQALDRSADDSLPTLTEAVSRTFAPLRTVADTIATLTETVARSVGTPRSVGDSLAGSGGAQLPLLLGGGTGGGITESVATQKNLVRTAADSVSSITESASRTSAKARAAADSVGAISESLGEDATEIRGTADSITAISEAVVGIKTGGTQNYTRSVGDSLAGGGGFPLLLGGSGAGIAESVNAVATPGAPNNYTRTASDSIAAISESVAWPAPSQGVEPAGQLLPRYLLPYQPQHFVRSVADEVEFLDERIDDHTTESDEWLVLDMPELVLT